MNDLPGAIIGREGGRQILASVARLSPNFWPGWRR